MSTGLEERRLRLEEKRLEIEERRVNTEAKHIELEQSVREHDLRLRERELAVKETPRRRWFTNPAVILAILVFQALVFHLVSDSYYRYVASAIWPEGDPEDDAVDAYARAQIDDMFAQLSELAARFHGGKDISHEQLQQDIRRMNTRLDEVAGAIAARDGTMYPLSLGFQVDGFSIFSESPSSTISDLFKAIKDGAEATNTSITAVQNIVKLWRLVWGEGDDKEGDNVVFFDDRVEFGFNDASLDQNAATLLRDVAIRLNADESNAKAIIVEGHTDAVGSAAYNRQLSTKRAEVVRDYLVSLGVKADRMRTVGYGEGCPRFPFEPNHDANRRVRVVGCTSAHDSDTCGLDG